MKTQFGRKPQTAFLYYVMEYNQCTSTNFLVFFQQQLEGGYNLFFFTSTNWMEAPTPWFSGTNLKVDTTTYLAPPYHPELQISSCSASFFNVVVYHHSTSFDFFLGPSTVIVLCSVTIVVLSIISFSFCHTSKDHFVKNQLHIPSFTRKSQRKFQQLLQCKFQQLLQHKFRQIFQRKFQRLLQNKLQQQVSENSTE